MANILDQHYSDLGGTDTSSNRMSQNPKTARSGSLNFQYSDGVNSDELASRKGFQHKALATYGAECGLIEYKYKDVNTGEAVTQILGVGKDGNLRKKIDISLKLTKASGNAYSYSFFYSGVGGSFWQFDIYSSTGTTLGTVNVITSSTLDSLVTHINSVFAIPGLTASVVDESGSTISSSLPAYLMDVVVEKLIPTGSILNPIYSWELVPNAGLNYLNSPLSVSYPCPFPNAKAAYLDEEWKGVSYTNLNNVCYITDGGFLMKYDGKSVYRAGMPRFSTDLGFSATSLADDTAGGLTENTLYKYIYQFGHVDQNGLEVLGKIVETEAIRKQLPLTYHSIFLPIYPVGAVQANGDFFPVYSCKLAAQITLTGTGSMTITVDAGHNIKVGMCLRLPIMVSVPTGWNFAYYKVSAITSNTITFNKTISNHYFPLQAAGAQMVLENNPDTVNVLRLDVVLNGCYVPTDWEGTATESYTTFSDSIQWWSPAPIYGAFVRIFRTQGGGEIFYKLADVAVSHQELWTVKDKLDDTTGTSTIAYLTTIPADFSLGEEIPRACGFVSQFQQQIVQGGRPYAPTTILNVPYPWYFGTAPTVGQFWGFPIIDAPWVYTEANLCDFQSIYWADSIAFEGFPQSGLNEESFEGPFSDQVNGAYPNKDVLFVFKDRTTGLLTGTLATSTITKEILEADVGSVNQSCIQEVNGFIMYLDATKGFQGVVAGRLPVSVGQPIVDQFKSNATKSPPTRLNLNRAQATNFKADDKYICYIPGGAQDSGTTTDNYYPTSSSLFFVFDYSLKSQAVPRNCWYFWNSTNNSVNALGGILATADDELLLAGLAVDNDQILWKQKFTETIYDYCDHFNAVPFVFNSAWLTYNLRSVDKNFNCLWINSIPGGFSLTVKQYGDWVETALGDQSITFSSSATKVKPKQSVHLNQPKLSAISIGLENSTVNQWVRIDGFEIELSSDYDIKEPRT